MIRQTRAAAAQIEALFEHFISRNRDGAARNLLHAVSEALNRIETDPAVGRSHPRPYPGVARWGFCWIRVRRYWFGYAVALDGPVLTNVIYDAADLPGRVEAIDDEAPMPHPGRQ